MVPYPVLTSLTGQEDRAFERCKPTDVPGVEYFNIESKEAMCLHEAVQRSSLVPDFLSPRNGDIEFLVRDSKTGEVNSLYASSKILKERSEYFTRSK